MNCNLNTFSGKYLTLTESETPWYNSENITLTKKYIKKNNKYPNNCNCEKYLDLEECSCDIENMENINKDKNVNNDKSINNNINVNDNKKIKQNLKKDTNNNIYKNKNNLNKNIIKMILLIFFILILLNVIIK